MKKVLLLTLLSVFAATAAFASTHWSDGIASGNLWPGSSGAVADTSAAMDVESISVSVSVTYNNGQSSVSGYNSDRNRDFVEASATLPSGAVPTKAEAFHSVSYPYGDFSGETSYNY